MKENEVRLVAPLWVIWAGLLFGGMILGGFEHIGSKLFIQATRLTSSFVLVIASWAWLSGANRPPIGLALLCLALGMSFGFLGDVSNSQILIRDPQAATMGGIVTFAIGHVAYIWAALSMGRVLQLRQMGTWLACVVFWQAVGITAWYLLLYRANITPEARELQWPALGYTMLLAGTAGVGSGLALQEIKLWAIMLGSALFLVSDFVLAIQLFRNDIDIADWLASTLGVTENAWGSHFCRQLSWHSCWLFYGPAQMLIVYSASGYLVAAKERLEKRTSTDHSSSRDGKQ